MFALASAAKLVDDMVFTSILPNDQFLPNIDRRSGSLVAEVLIGSNVATGLIYALRVILCQSFKCDDIGEDAAELIFVIAGYDEVDADAEEKIFYSGSDTVLHILIATFGLK